MADTTRHTMVSKFNVALLGGVNLGSVNSAPWVQGILNLTPDSFSDGATDHSVAHAVARALAMVEHGAHLIDVGGESTRPGYTPIDAAQELQRIMPVIAALASQHVAVSVDTHKPCVMQAALKAGVCMVNDVNALHGVDDTGTALDAVRHSHCGIVIMDGFSSQSQMHKRAGIGLVDRLAMRYAEIVAQGIAPQRLMIDPGIGFDKNLAENLDCIRLLPQLKQIAPVLVGGSRKSLLGLITQKPVQERMPASIALAVLAAQQGASMLRVHDVAATVDALKVWQALLECEIK